MNEILETNRAYHFARLESALLSGRSDQARSALVKLKRLGIEIRLSPDLQLLAKHVTPDIDMVEDRLEAS